MELMFYHAFPTTMFEHEESLMIQPLPFGY
jgi:hypothetical protein